MWWLAGLAGFAVLGWGLLSSRRILYPKHRAIAAPEPMPSYAVHPLQAPDGSSFDVWRLCASNPRAHVVMCHGYYANRLQVLGIADGLRARGYDALLMELRGHGARPGPCTMGLRESEDIGAVLAWLAQQDGARPLPAGVFGFSMGAAVACQAAARYEQVRAVVADSVYGTFFSVVRVNIRRLYHLPVLCAWLTWWSLQLSLGRSLSAVDPTALAPRMRQPLLAIQGGADRHITAAESERLFERWAGPKQRWFEADVAHVGMSKRFPQRYCDRVAAFLNEALCGS